MRLSSRRNVYFTDTKSKFEVRSSKWKLEVGSWKFEVEAGSTKVEERVSELFFNGDPEVDSTRRHLERVLNSPKPRRRWPLALAVGGTAWGLWRLLRRTTSNRATAAISTRNSGRP
jgi:hypothetical protein